MNPQPQLQELPFTEQNPEVARAALMKTHFVNAEYWAKRVPFVDGDNKRAAVSACMGSLKLMLAACQK